MKERADIPEFELAVDDRGHVRFAHPAQAHAYLRGKFAGQVIVGQFYPHRAKRSDRQSRAAHALIAQWIASSESLRGQSIEDVKQWLLWRAFGYHEVTDGQTGEVVKVLAEPHTSKLTVGQFCEFIELILNLAAEDGVVLMAPDQYRVAKEKERRRLERQAQKGRAA